MSDLPQLLDRLKAARRAIIAEAANGIVLPPEGMIRRLAYLQGAITAVEAQMGEQAERRPWPPAR